MNVFNLKIVSDLCKINGFSIFLEAVSNVTPRSDDGIRSSLINRSHKVRYDYLTQLPVQAVTYTPLDVILLRA